MSKPVPTALLLLTLPSFSNSEWVLTKDTPKAAKPGTHFRLIGTAPSIVIQFYERKLTTRPKREFVVEVDCDGENYYSQTVHRNNLVKALEEAHEGVTEWNNLHDTTRRERATSPGNPFAQFVGQFARIRPVAGTGRLMSSIGTRMRVQQVTSDRNTSRHPNSEEIPKTEAVVDESHPTPETPITLDQIMTRMRLLDERSGHKCDDPVYCGLGTVVEYIASIGQNPTATPGRQHIACLAFLALDVATRNGFTSAEILTEMQRILRSAEKRLSQKAAAKSDDSKSDDSK